MTINLMDNLSNFISFGALVIAFLAFRTTGRRMRANHRQEWLTQLRKNIAEFYSALTPISEPLLDQHLVDQNRLTYLVEHTCLLLDERADKKYKTLRGILVQTALAASDPVHGNLIALFDNIRVEATKIVQDEAKAIENELERIF